MPLDNINDPWRHEEEEPEINAAPPPAQSGQQPEQDDLGGLPEVSTEEQSQFYLDALARSQGAERFEPNAAPDEPSAPTEPGPDDIVERAGQPPVEAPEPPPDPYAPTWEQKHDIRHVDYGMGMDDERRARDKLVDQIKAQVRFARDHGQDVTNEEWGDNEQIDAVLNGYGVRENFSPEATDMLNRFAEHVGVKYQAAKDEMGRLEGVVNTAKNTLNPNAIVEGWAETTKTLGWMTGSVSDQDFEDYLLDKMDKDELSRISDPGKVEGLKDVHGVLDAFALVGNVFAEQSSIIAESMIVAGLSAATGGAAAGAFGGARLAAREAAEKAVRKAAQKEIRKIAEKKALEATARKAGAAAAKAATEAAARKATAKSIGSNIGALVVDAQFNLGSSAEQRMSEAMARGSTHIDKGAVFGQAAGRTFADYFGPIRKMATRPFRAGTTIQQMAADGVLTDARTFAGGLVGAGARYAKDAFGAGLSFEGETISDRITNKVINDTYLLNGERDWTDAIASDLETFVKGGIMSVTGIPSLARRSFAEVQMNRAVDAFADTKGAAFDNAFAKSRRERDTFASPGFRSLDLTSQRSILEMNRLKAKLDQENNLAKSGTAGEIGEAAGNAVQIQNQIDKLRETLSPEGRKWVDAYNSQFNRPGVGMQDFDKAVKSDPNVAAKLQTEYAPDVSGVDQVVDWVSKLVGKELSYDNIRDAANDNGGLVIDSGNVRIRIDDGLENGLVVSVCRTDGGPMADTYVSEFRQADFAEEGESVDSSDAFYKTLQAATGCARKLSSWAKWSDAQTYGRDMAFANALAQKSGRNVTIIRSARDLENAGLVDEKGIFKGSNEQVLGDLPNGLNGKWRGVTTGDGHIYVNASAYRSPAELAAIIDHESFHSRFIEMVQNGVGEKEAQKIAADFERKYGRPLSADNLKRAMKATILGVELTADDFAGLNDDAVDQKLAKENAKKLDDALVSREERLAYDSEGMIPQKQRAPMLQKLFRNIPLLKDHLSRYMSEQLGRAPTTQEEMADYLFTVMSNTKSDGGVALIGVPTVQSLEAVATETSGEGPQNGWEQTFLPTSQEDAEAARNTTPKATENTRQALGDLIVNSLKDGVVRSKNKSLVQQVAAFLEGLGVDVTDAKMEGDEYTVKIDANDTVNALMYLLAGGGGESGAAEAVNTIIKLADALDKNVNVDEQGNISFVDRNAESEAKADTAQEQTAENKEEKKEEPAPATPLAPSAETVDNTASKEGTENGQTRENAEPEDEFGAVQRASRGLSDEERRAYRRGRKELGVREIGIPVGGRSANRDGTLVRALRGRILQSGRGGRGLLDVEEATTRERDHQPAETFAVGRVDGQTFRDVFEVVRTYLRNGELVDLHDSYGEDVKCYLSEDGLSGFAVEKDGNLVSVFSLRPGSLEAMAPLMKKAGATHLDAYNSHNQPLAEIYKRKLGFRVAASMDYNMEYDHDDIAKNHGSPRVVFMVLPKEGQTVEVRDFDKDSYDAAVAWQKEQLDWKKPEKKTLKRAPAEQKKGETAEKKTLKKKPEAVAPTPAPAPAQSEKPANVPQPVESAKEEKKPVKSPKADDSNATVLTAAALGVEIANEPNKEPKELRLEGGLTLGKIRNARESFSGEKRALFDRALVMLLSPGVRIKSVNADQFAALVSKVVGVSPEQARASLENEIKAKREKGKQARGESKSGTRSTGSSHIQGAVRTVQGRMAAVRDGLSGKRKARAMSPANQAAAQSMADEIISGAPAQGPERIEALGKAVADLVTGDRVGGAGSESARTRAAEIVASELAKAGGTMADVTGGPKRTVSRTKPLTPEEAVAWRTDRGQDAEILADLADENAETTPFQRITGQNEDVLSSEKANTDLLIGETAAQTVGPAAADAMLRYIAPISEAADAPKAAVERAMALRENIERAVFGKPLDAFRKADGTDILTPEQHAEAEAHLAKVREALAKANPVARPIEDTYENRLAFSRAEDLKKLRDKVGREDDAATKAKSKFASEDSLRNAERTNLLDEAASKSYNTARSRAKKTLERPDDRRAAENSPERLVVGGYGEEEAVNRTLEQVASLVGGSPGAESAARTLAGLDKQTFQAVLSYAAQQEGTWIGDLSTVANTRSKIGSGQESVVYLANDGAHVIKVNAFTLIDSEHSPLDFFDGIKAYNELCPDTKLDIIGFTEDASGAVCAVLRQPRVKSSRNATQEQIDNYFNERGFTVGRDRENGNRIVHTSAEFTILDAEPRNVLVGKDGNLYFIDLIVSRNKAASQSQPASGRQRSSFASDESLRAASSPSGVQKSADVNYPDAGAEIASARFASIGSQRKAEMGRLLAKHRPDLNADEVVAELEKFGTVKEQKAALHWVIRGGLALPQDAYKVSDALSVAEKAKVDPFRYKSPDELLLANKDFKPSARPIDPATVPELSDARDEGDGIVSYLVQDDRQGQAAMRRIIDTHWGEDANPWCLLAWKDDPRVSNEVYQQFKDREGYDAHLAEAWRWWQNYSALPKRVAFQNGRLLAFMATERGQGDGKVEFSKPENERRVESFYKEYSKIPKDERPGNFQQWMMEEHPEEYDAIAEDEEDGGDAINTYQFSRPAEEWWDRRDESHPDLDWAKEGDYAPSRFASDASLRAAEGGLTGSALSDPNIVALALGAVRVHNPDGSVSYSTNVTDLIRAEQFLNEDPKFAPWTGRQNLRAVFAEAGDVLRKDPAAAERIKEKVLDAYKKYQAGDKNAAARLSVSAHDVQVLRAMLVKRNQALVAANDAVADAENNGADNLNDLRVAELNAEAQYYDALMACGFAERAIGTALGSIARLMENDFSMGGILKKLGDVDGGVTAEDAKKLRGVSREGEAAQKKHDDAVKAIEEEERKKLVAGKVDDAVGEGRRNKAAGRKAKTVAEAVEAARKELADGEMVDISVYPELWAQIGDAVKGIARAIIGEHLDGPSRLKALDHAAFARRLLAETNKAFEGRITSRDENHKELTERDVLDLFSDYGDPEKLQEGYGATDIGAGRLREAQSRLKKLSQMMSALADIKAGKAPLEAYGHLRDLTPKQVDEEMERVKKEMDEAWRASGLDKNLLHRAMSPVELVREGIEKRIAEIKANLAAGELAKKQGRKPIAGEEGLAGLREELKMLQSIQDSVFKNRGLTDEQRLAAIEENYRRTEASAMATLQRLMAGGRPVKPLDMSDDGARSAWATAERAWRQKIGEARRAAADATRRLNEIRQRMTPESYRGEKALERAIARREDMAARWEEAVNAGRVTLGGRGIMRDQKMRFDPRLVEADRALRDVIAKRDRLIAEIKYDHAKGWEKLKMNLSAIPNTMRQMLASGDNSGIGVQCAVATLANPKDGIKAIFPGIKVFWNTLLGDGMATERYMESIYRDPDFERIAAYVEIPRTDGKGNFTQNSTEEFFQHGVVADRLQKILHVPLFDNKYMRASEAGFNVPVAMIRFELAKRLLAHLRDMKGEGYTPTNEEMSLLGKVVNAATGRGKFFSGGGPVNLSNVFWASGRVSGQVESLFLPARLFLKHGEVDLAFRKKIARELIWKPWRNFAAAALLFGLAHAIFKDEDDDDPFMELDPTSSKFLRMKVGTRYFDITSGMPSYITLAAKGIWGEKKTVGGKRVALRGQGAFGQSWSNELWRFFRNKLRPEYGNIISLFDGRNAIGEEIEPTALGVSKFLAVNGFLPLTAKDIVDSIEDFDRNGPLFTASLALLANIGYTTSNFGQTPYKNDRAAIETIDEVRKQAEAGVEGMDDAWSDIALNEDNARYIKAASDKQMVKLASRIKELDGIIRNGETTKDRKSGRVVSRRKLTREERRAAEREKDALEAEYHERLWPELRKLR